MNTPRPPGLDFETARTLLTEHRRERIDKVVRQRFRTLTVVVEDIRDPHNQAAVLRTAEGLGLETAHVVDTGDARKGLTHTFQPNRGITRDADKWMRIGRHRTVGACVEELKAQGFAIYAGALDPAAVSLYSLDVQRPCAFVFGNEHRGVSAELRAAATQLFSIPMRGFVESFNVSVAAAICLSHAVQARVAAGRDTDLDEAEREALRLAYERKSLKRYEQLMKAAEAGAAIGSANPFLDESSAEANVPSGA
jgi:tRNA (guanosine-2'-O-)-methyltransferase